MIYSRVKRDKITSWLKEVLHMPIEGEILNTSMYELELSVRATNALNKMGIKSISDFILLGPEKLCRVKSVGKNTIYEIGNAILSKLHKSKEKLSPETQCALFETDSSKATFEETFEEMTKNSFTEKMLNTPIEELRLSTRTINALRRANLKTIKDIIELGLHTLHERKNVGRKTIEDIKNAISMLNKAQTHAIEEISFNDAIENILSILYNRPKSLYVIKARFGYEDGKQKTLEEIGNIIGLTRERVRQIIVKEIKRLKHPTRRNALRSPIENIEKLLHRYKGIISINDIGKDEYFIFENRKQLRFLMNLIAELFEERYRTIDKYFLTSLDNNEIEALHFQIREAALKSQFPIDEKVFLKNIISSIGPISEDYLIYHLIYREHIEISKGKVISPGRLSIPQRVKLLMRDVDRPMHFTEIAKLYRNHFGEAKIRTSDLERAIHTRIGDSRNFIIVGPGTFILKDKFKTPDNINEIVETSKEILQGLKTISDTKFLISELKKRNINVGNLNEYSLKPVLLEYPGFVKYRKFEIGIEELADKYERKPLNDLMFEILSSATKPMHVKTIWKEILKQRGSPEYAISQRLADDSRFIRVAPSSYTLAKNITQYEEKRKIIVDFAKEWIQLKGNAISAFFISEVLKATEEIRDCPIGLVEHILATSQEFIKLPNGFYDLAEKRHEHRN